MLLEVDVFSRHATDSVAAFLHRPTENYDIADAEFLADTGRYLTVLGRRENSGQLHESERNYIKNWI